MEWFSNIVCVHEKNSLVIRMTMKWQSNAHDKNSEACGQLVSVNLCTKLSHVDIDILCTTTTEDSKGVLCHLQVEVLYCMDVSMGPCQKALQETYRGTTV